MLTPAQIASWMAKPKSGPLRRVPSGETEARYARMRAEMNRRQAALAARANMKKKRALKRWRDAVKAIRSAQRALKKSRLVPGYGSRSKTGLSENEIRTLAAYNLLSNKRVLKRTGSSTYRTFA